LQAISPISYLYGKDNKIGMLYRLQYVIINLEKSLKIAKVKSEDSKGEIRR
jgi:hypothetical protein